MDKQYSLFPHRGTSLTNKEWEKAGSIRGGVNGRIRQYRLKWYVEYGKGSDGRRNQALALVLQGVAINCRRKIKNFPVLASIHMSKVEQLFAEGRLQEELEVLALSEVMKCT